MPAIGTSADVAKKWARVTPTRQQDYVQGVQDPKRDWAKATAEAESNYELGVQEAIAQKRFGKGVLRAGTDTWQAKTIALGPQRWAQGVLHGENAYESGFAPYRETISQLSLSPRGPVGSPQNLTRVAEVANALHARKLSLGG